jgi:hypothetical protein
MRLAAGGRSPSITEDAGLPVGSLDDSVGRAHAPARGIHN